MSFVTLTYALFLYFFSLLFLLPLLIKTLVYLHASSTIHQLLMAAFLAILCSLGLAVPTAMLYLSLVVG